MALTEIGTASSTVGNTTLTVTLTDSVPVGQHVVLLVTYNSDLTEKPTSVVDSDGVNTYQEDDSAAQSTNNAVIAYSCKVTDEIENGDQITITWATNKSRKSVRVLKITDLASTGWFVENGRNTGSNAGSISAVTDANLAADDYYIIGAATINLGSTTSLTMTPGTGYTKIGTEMVIGASGIRGACAEFLTYTAPGGATKTADATTTATTGWAMIVLAYKKLAASAISKSGGFTSAASAGGTGGIRLDRTGGNTSAASAGAPRTVIAAKTVGAISPGVFGLSKTAEFVKSGGTQSALTLGGPGFTGSTFTKSGGFSSAATFGVFGRRVSAFGPWSYTRSFFVTSLFAKSGGFTSGGVAGASRLIQVTKSGGGISPGVLGASKAVSIPKAGGSSSQVSTGAQRAYSVARAGGTASAGKLGGSVTTGNIISKTGGSISAGTLGISRTVNFIKSGGATAAGSIGSPRTVRYSKTAGTISAGVFSVSTSIPVQKTGGFTGSGILGASRAYSLAKTGGSSSAATAGASKTYRYVKAGGTVSAGVLGAAVSRTQINVKTGGWTGASTFGISRSYVIAKTGGSVSTGRIGAARLLYGKTGGFIAAGRIGGTVRIASVILPGKGKPGILMAVNRPADNRLVGA